MESEERRMEGSGENAVNPCTDRWKCRSNRRYDVLPA